jgi:hypothetical protein
VSEEFLDDRSIDYELPYSVLGKILDKLMFRKGFELFLDGGAKKAKEILEAPS